MEFRTILVYKYFLLSLAVSGGVPLSNFIEGTYFFLMEQENITIGMAELFLTGKLIDVRSLKVQLI